MLILRMVERQIMYQDGLPAHTAHHRYALHPGINRAQHRVTLLIKTNTLLLYTMLLILTHTSNYLKSSAVQWQHWADNIRCFFAGVFFEWVRVRRHSGWDDHFTVWRWLRFLGLRHGGLPVHVSRAITLHQPQRQYSLYYYVISRTRGAACTECF